MDSRSTAALSDTLVSEALYGMYLLSRRSRYEPKACESDGLSTAASEGSEEMEELNALPKDLPPGLGYPPGLEEQVEAAQVHMHEATGSFESVWPWWTLASPHLLGLLSSRRGKQRMRTVEQQSGARLTLDESWQIIHISGSWPAICKAQELLEVMEGFLVEISNTMWSELMRCRSEESSSLLTLNKVQEIVGFRVHLERETLAVRIFAPKSMEPSAKSLLRRFEDLCTREVMLLPEDCDWNQIKQLQRSSVTLKVNGGLLELEGFGAAVRDMKEDLKKCLQLQELEGHVRPLR